MKKKTLRETQTLSAGCSKAEPKIIAHTADPFRGGVEPKNENAVLQAFWRLFNAPPLGLVH